MTPREHEFESDHGLPEPLPANERQLWQGSPDWQAMALHVFHLRKLAVYFALLLCLQWALAIGSDVSPMVQLKTTLGYGLMATLALGTLALLAWLSAREAVYTLTDRRLVMRVGIVLTLTFNLPLRRIASAHTLQRRDGSQDISLELLGEDKIAFFHLWPHTRPWRMARPQPTLRCLPRNSPAAALLSQAWLAQVPQGTATPGATVPQVQSHDADASARPQRGAGPGAARLSKA